MEGLVWLKAMFGDRPAYPGEYLQTEYEWRNGDKIMVTTYLTAVVYDAEFNYPDPDALPEEWRSVESGRVRRVAYQNESRPRLLLAPK